MKVRITNNDKIIAINDSDRLDFEMDMKNPENQLPIRANMRLGAWLLVEGTDGDGTKFLYIVGLPKKADAPITGKDELLSKGKEMLNSMKGKFKKGGVKK